MGSDFHVVDHDILLLADSIDQFEGPPDLEEGQEEQNDDLLMLSHKKRSFLIPYHLWCDVHFL